MFSAIRTRLTLRSIRARLTFWYVLTLGVVLCGFAASFWFVRARTLYREFDAALELRGHDLVADLRPALLDLDPPSVLAGDPAAARVPILVRVLRGGVLYRAPAFPMVGWAAERDLAAAARGDRLVVVPVSDLSHRQLRVATIRVDRQGTDALAVQVAAPIDPVRIALRQLGGGMALAVVLVLAIAAYGSGRTTRYAFAPVDAIVARVRAIQSTGVSERLDISGGSAELDRLIITLNDMLDRIEASMRSARRFAADASHELQTPLTIMRGLVESANRRAGASGQADLGEDLLLEIERSSMLIRDLRLLALAEAGQVVAAREPVDMAALAEECAEIARAIAEPKQIRVDLVVDTRPVVAGAALHLRRVLLNIAANAVAYSPIGSAIRISVTCHLDQALVEVRDEGCGISPEDLPHIFEPFYRADPARARDTGGTGLGLAIADQIVRAHHGHIVVSSDVGRGSTFTVALPQSGP